MNLTPEQRAGALPNPDNAEVWRRVLDCYGDFAPDYRGYICDHLAKCNRDGVISWPERRELEAEVNLFLSPPLSGLWPAVTLANAAQQAVKWPPDLCVDWAPDCVEFRRRWMRWRAGLPHGPLPWADALAKI